MEMMIEYHQTRNTNLITIKILIFPTMKGEIMVTMTLTNLPLITIIDNHLLKEVMPTGIKIMTE